MTTKKVNIGLTVKQSTNPSRNVTSDEPETASMSKCAYPSCEDAVVCDGYCRFHYQEEHYTSKQFGTCVNSVILPEGYVLLANASRKGKLAHWRDDYNEYGLQANGLVMCLGSTGSKHFALTTQFPIAFLWPGDVMFSPLRTCL